MTARLWSLEGALVCVHIYDSQRAIPKSPKAKVIAAEVLGLVLNAILGCHTHAMEKRAEQSHGTSAICTYGYKKAEDWIRYMYGNAVDLFIAIGLCR